MSNISHDVQASHKVLTLLEDANTHSERIIDSLPGVFLIINSEFEILRGNFEASKVFNIDYESLLRTSFSSLFKKEVWEIFEYQFKELEKKSNNSKVKFELSICDNSHESSERPFYWQLSKMPNSNNAEGEIFSLMGEDISELRNAENRLTSIFTNIPLGILTINVKGKIEDTYSNYLHCLLGDQEFTGKSFRSLMFDPIDADLSRDEKQGIDNIETCLNNEERLFEALSLTFPKKIFLYTNGDKSEGKHLQISYKAVAYEGVVKQLLIILEDRTTIIDAEKEQERANLLEKQSQAIYESAIRDPLTGLFTRLYMEDRVEDMLSNHNRNNIQSASLVLFDVDFFKPVNDNFGHDVGDRVLKDIAAIILQQVRNTDIPIRFGGEEFMVFLPGDAKSAYLFAERVRKNVERLEIFADNKKISVTISGGIVSHLTGETLNQLIKRADQLLYKAKKEGRNRNIQEDAAN